MLARTLAACLVLCCAHARAGVSDVSVPIAGSTEEIPVRVMVPDRAGVFSAVVVLHDCSGLGPRSSGSPWRWAAELVKRGFVVFLPDSFSSRGHPDGVCTNASSSRNEVNAERRVRDAYAVLAYARTLASVDGRRIGVMGGSHGGTTTLLAMSAPISDGDVLAQEKGEGFAAGIALYPGCGARFGGWIGRSGTYKTIAPLMILTGEKDDWTPADACVNLVKSAKAAAQPVSIKVYPGAHHSFDSANPVRYNGLRVNPNAPGGRGATTGGDAGAWADSIQEVGAFFAQHLPVREDTPQRETR